MMAMSAKRIDTLVVVTKSQQILLGLKKRGFGSHKWNGFGGKVEANESIEDGAKRELKEECNLTCHTLNKKGILSFNFRSDPTAPNGLEIHVFHTNHFSGEVQESDEMKPKWFSYEDIPYHQMWSDDRLWLPLLLKGSLFRGFFTFIGQSVISEYILQELNNDCELKPIENNL